MHPLHYHDGAIKVTNSAFYSNRAMHGRLAATSSKNLLAQNWEYNKCKSLVVGLAHCERQIFSSQYCFYRPEQAILRCRQRKGLFNFVARAWCSKNSPTSASLEKNTDDLLKTAWTEVIIVTYCFWMKACCNKGTLNSSYLILCTTKPRDYEDFITLNTFSARLI